MPRRPNTGRRLTVRNVQYNNRMGGVGRALIQGTAMAYRNRAAISSVGRTARTLVSKATSYLRKKYVPKKGKLVDTDRIQQDIGAGGELTKEHVTIGRRKKLHLKGVARKMIIGAENTQILRFGGLQPFMNVTYAPANAKKTEVGGGAYWLQNFFNGVSGLYQPCHVYDITSLANVINGTYSAASPGWVMKFVTTNPGTVPISAVLFDNLYGNYGSGTSLNSSSTWQAEDTAAGANAPGSQPLRRCLQDWTQAKLLCYGAAKQATNFVIEFIQLKEDWLHPEFCSINTTQIAADYLNAQIAFWEHYVKSSVSHPIATSSPLKRNMFKVLKTIRFTLNPRLSTETDANVGHCKQINVFYHMNRLCKYDWAENGIEANINLASAYAQNAGALQNVVHPRARIYMTIRATNTNYVNNVAPSTDYTPSYDIVLRKKFTTLQ